MSHAKSDVYGVTSAVDRRPLTLIEASTQRGGVGNKRRSLSQCPKRPHAANLLHADCARGRGHALLLACIDHNSSQHFCTSTLVSTLSSHGATLWRPCKAASNSVDWLGR